MKPTKTMGLMAAVLGVLSVSPIVQAVPIEYLITGVLDAGEIGLPSIIEPRVDLSGRAYELRLVADTRDVATADGGGSYYFGYDALVWSEMEIDGIGVLFSKYLNPGFFKSPTGFSGIWGRIDGSFSVTVPPGSIGDPSRHEPFAAMTLTSGASIGYVFDHYFADRATDSSPITIQATVVPDGGSTLMLASMAGLLLSGCGAWVRRR